MKLLVVSTFLLLLSGSIHAEECGCKKATSTEQTRWSDNERISIYDSHSYRQLRGTVHLSSDETHVLPNALVEVYKRYDKRARRIAACITGTNGVFCFNGLRAGRYRLRVSIDSRWKVTDIDVVVNPGRKNSRRSISVDMSPGT